MKKVFIFSAAVLALAACSNEDFIGENNSQVEKGTPLTFSITSKGTSRAGAEGADAAKLLGNKFVVDGSKGEGKTEYAKDVVFDQYNVAWTQNTAQTSQSNSSNWEYVGLDVNANSKVAAQTIKYWDYSTDVYDFIAWSAGVKTAVYGTATPTDGQVHVSAINRDNIGKAATTGNEVYKVTGKAADLANFYISDVNTVKNADYGKPVKIEFRSLASKIRVGFYETIPGYSIEKIEFYTAEKSSSTTASDATTTASLYAPSAVFSQDGTMSVWYPIVGTANDSKAAYNEAVVKLEATASTGKKDLELGTITYNTLKEKAEDGSTTVDTDYEFIGRSASAPTYIGSAETNYYTLVVPTGVGNVLNLRVNYTLKSIDGSGEEIYVKGATAQVPATYTSWLPNYAYTYLFKISDNTNGYTGKINNSPVGLYPITFDAVVVNAEEGSFQETVTTVATNTITTYQYGQKVTTKNEYATGTDVYAIVNGGIELNTTPSTVGNATTYVVTGTSTLVPGTEADIIDALKVQASKTTDGVITGRNGLVLKPATDDEAVKLNTADTELKAEDGSTYKLAANTVAIFKPATTGKLAFVYTAAVDATTTDDAQYEAKAMTAGTSVVGMYKYKTEKCTTGAKYVIGTTYYSDAACTTKVDASAFIAGVTLVENYYTIDKNLANLVEIKAPTTAGEEPEKAIAGVTYFVKYNYYKDADYSVKVLQVQ